MTPEARKNDLLIGEIGDELVIYDRQHDHAHRLNHTAALVWRHADGSRSIGQIAGLLREQLDPTADEALVRLTLDRLETARLLEPAWHADLEAAASRRQFLRRAAV